MPFAEPARFAAERLDRVTWRDRTADELDEDLGAGRRAEHARLGAKPSRRLGLELCGASAEAQHACRDPLRVRAKGDPELILAEPTVRDERGACVATVGRDLACEPIDLVARELAAGTEEAHERLALRARRRGHEISITQDEATDNALVLEAERAAQSSRDRVREEMPCVDRTKDDDPCDRGRPYAPRRLG